jgi:hypothetical protein
MTALSDVLSISHFVNWLKWLIKTVLVLFWFLILLQGRPFFLSISLKELEVRPKSPLAHGIALFLGLIESP